MWGEVRGCLMCRDAPCGHPVPYERFLLAAILSMAFSILPQILASLVRQSLLPDGERCFRGKALLNSK